MSGVKCAENEREVYTFKLFLRTVFMHGYTCNMQNTKTQGIAKYSNIYVEVYVFTQLWQPVEKMI
jgi:hypothetical protein